LKDKDFRLVLVPLLSSMMIATGACYDQSREDDQYSRVCVDRSTGTRVEDNRCGQHSTGMAGGFYAWYFLSGGGARFMPGIGSPVRGGTFETPRGYNPATGAPADSSSARRGGFGSSARGRAGVGS
jgi:hypothetical protein